MYDPRISSDERKGTRGAGYSSRSVIVLAEREGNPSFLFLDPPDHNRLRRIVMREFTPERVEGMRYRVIQLVNELLDAQRDHGQLDIVEDLAYPLPVTVISEMLGVPREDIPRFKLWVPALIHRIEPAQVLREPEYEKAFMEMREYLRGLIAARRTRPADDLISGLVAANHDDPAEQMNEQDLLATVSLMFIAGHETTVNLITNGMLTLLRHPDALVRLRSDPDSVIRTVEEVLY